MKIGKNFLKIVSVILGIGFIGYLGLICFLLFGARLNSYSEQVPFDSDKWKAHLADQDLSKQRMIEDLLSRHKLVGLRRQDIEDLLGTPPANKNFKDYDYTYWLGSERNGLGVDSEWLGIKFQESIVIQADIFTD